MPKLDKLTAILHPDPVVAFRTWRHFDPDGIPFNLVVITDNISTSTAELINDYGAQQAAILPNGASIWRLPDGRFTIISGDPSVIPGLLDASSPPKFWNWWRKEDCSIDAIRDRRQIREMIEAQHRFN